VDALGGLHGVVVRLAAGALILLLAACGPQAGAPEAPTIEQALAHVEAIIDLVESGGASRVCDFGGPTCPASVEPLDLRAVPATRPKITSVRVVPRVDHDNGTWSNAYVRVELCGIDGLGKIYHSEMMVYWHRGRIVSTEPAYWLGIGIADDNIVGAPAGPSQPCLGG